MLFQLKKLPEIIYLTLFLKSFWILYIDQIIVYNAFYSKLTFCIIKDRCQMHALKVFRSPVWLLLHKLSSPHYRYIRKMRRGDRLPLTQIRACFGKEIFQQSLRSPDFHNSTTKIIYFYQINW